MVLRYQTFHQQASTCRPDSQTFKQRLNFKTKQVYATKMVSNLYGGKDFKVSVRAKITSKSLNAFASTLPGTQSDLDGYDLTLAEKFQAVYQIFFPETVDDSSPSAIVKSRLNDILHFDRHGITEREYMDLRARVRRVVAKYMDMYPEEVYGTQMQPSVNIKYDRDLEQQVCTVKFRVIRVKPALVKHEMDEEEEIFWQQQVEEELSQMEMEQTTDGERPTSPHSPKHASKGLRGTEYDYGEPWIWDE